jgi:menaquinone-dependent protoporphyrinogen oxidase
VCIAFGTTTGHTVTVAEALQQAIAAAGHQVTVINLMTDPGDLPADVTGVIVAASLHFGQIQAPVKQFITTHRQRLQELPTALLTVALCMLRGDAGRQEGLTAVESQLREVDWQPEVSELVAGARDYAHYGFFKRLFMRWLARRSGSQDVDMSRSYVYTDFTALRRFGVTFAERATPAPTHR